MERKWLGGQNYLFNLVSAYLEICGVGDPPPVIISDKNPLPEIFRELEITHQIETLTVPDLARIKHPRNTLWVLTAGRNKSLHSTLLANGITRVFSPTLFLGRLPDIEILTWLPDFQHRDLPEFFSMSRRILRELSYRLCLRQSDRAMVSSRAAANAIEKMSSRYAQIPLAIVPFTPSLTPVSNAAVRNTLRRYDLKEGFLYLPNQFWAHKNHTVVLDALRSLHVEGWQGQVVMTGTAFDHRRNGVFKELQSQITALSTAGVAKFLGEVPRPDMIALMQSCKAVINPSLYEGWSSTVEEALCLGSPLILSNIAIHKEQAGTSARYFDPHDQNELAHLIRSAEPVTTRTALSPEAQIRKARFQDALRSVFNLNRPPYPSQNRKGKVRREINAS